MKKGFTLVELLGVIVILAVISMIAVPLIDRSINEGDEDLYNTQMNQILKAAKNYYAENLEKLNSVDSSCEITDSSLCGEEEGPACCVNLNKLISDGYLPTEVNNPKTGKPFSNTLTYVTVTRVASDEDKEHFEYTVNTEDAVIHAGEDVS